jgi:hypothetical protein
MTKIVCLRSNHIVSPAFAPNATFPVTGARAIAWSTALHNTAMLRSKTIKIFDNQLLGSDI